MTQEKTWEEKEMERQKKMETSTSIQPDPETLGTTDPQEHMKGPISSFVQKVKEKVEEGNSEKPGENK